MRLSDEKLNFGVYQTMCGINEERVKKTENCRGCIYHGYHQDMGATIEVCNREEDLGKAVAACATSANCGIKLTLADVEKLKTERDVARPEYRTIYGFDIEELRKLALILRELEIEPHELKRFMDDMGNTYTKCMEHAFRQIQKTFDEVFI